MGTFLGVLVCVVLSISFLVIAWLLLHFWGIVIAVIVIGFCIFLAVDDDIWAGPYVAIMCHFSDIDDRRNKRKREAQAAEERQQREERAQKNQAELLRRTTERINEAREFSKNQAVQKLLQSMESQFTYHIGNDIKWENGTASIGNNDQFLHSIGKGLIKFRVSEKDVKCFYVFKEHGDGQDFFLENNLWTYSFNQNGFSNQPDSNKRILLYYAFLDMLIPGYERKYPGSTFEVTSEGISMNIIKSNPNPNYNQRQW